MDYALRNPSVIPLAVFLAFLVGDINWQSILKYPSSTALARWDVVAKQSKQILVPRLRFGRVQ